MRGLLTAINTKANISSAEGTQIKLARNTHIAQKTAGYLGGSDPWQSPGGENVLNF